MDTQEKVEFWYEMPQLVRYWRADLNTYCLGIAFHSYIIDCDTGALFSIKEILSHASTALEADDLIIEYEWMKLGDC